MKGTTPTIPLTTGRVSNQKKSRNVLVFAVLFLVLLVQNFLMQSSHANLIINLAHASDSVQGEQPTQIHSLVGGSATLTDSEYPNDVCSILGQRQCFGGAVSTVCQYPSASVVWDQHRLPILNASIFPQEFGSNTTFVEWVSELLGQYTPSQMRLSISHAANPIPTMRILQILSRRYTAQKENSDNDTTGASLPEPLRILVTGGSVTQGINCDTNPIGMPERPNCAWPHRLEYMLNHAFFEGYPVVQVVNIGMVGSSAQVAAISMEYRLLPNPRELPHIVIYGHSANDARESDLDEFARTQMQNYIRAAYSLRPCDDDLPVVVVTDDLYTVDTKRAGPGGTYSLAREWSSQLYNIASWYNLMFINYPNTVRDLILPNLGNDTFVRRFLGSRLALHLGVGFHIGMAWTILFNFLTAFSDACNDPKKLAPSDVHVVPPKNGFNVKYIGAFESGGRFQNVSEDWLENIVKSKEQCLELGNSGSSKDDVACTYAWMATKTAGILWPPHVDRALKSVLVESKGWEALGSPTHKPRTAWYAQEANASFALKLVPTIPTRSFTIMSMQSYGPKFVDVRLEIVIRVIHAKGKVGDGEEEPSVGTFEINPFHATTTSVHVPHKFELPGGGAKKGDVVKVHARLTSGSYFKIQGLAFCRN